MRLLSTSSLKLQTFIGGTTPPYVILSHTWGEDEVLFDHVVQRTMASRKGYAKVLNCYRKAASDGFEWVWIDSCCIDKSSSAELSEAINSMYKWYEDSVICYAFLEDVSLKVTPTAMSAKSFPRFLATMNSLKANAPGGSLDAGDAARLEELTNLSLNEGTSEKGFSIAGSRWFTRGWTLQELIAPKVVEFYTEDWVEIGTKQSLAVSLSDITGIPIHVLRGKSPMTCSVAERMSWASERQTTREEDLGYCLLGLFNVNMPMLYGEGSKSFLRLQEQILKQEYDYSLFAWTLQQDCGQSLTGMLASSPAAFRRSTPSGLQIPTLLDEMAFFESAGEEHHYKDPLSTLDIKPVFLQPRTFASQVRDGRDDDYLFINCCDVLFSKEYKWLRRNTLPSIVDAGVELKPPELTSLGLRMRLSVIRPQKPEFPLVAYINCDFKDRLLCILLRPLSEHSSILYGRFLAPWLVTLDQSFREGFEQIELYLHPHGVYEDQGLIQVLPDLDSTKWGRAQVLVPDTEPFTTHVTSAFPITGWNLEEFFFSGEPKAIGSVLLESENGRYSTMFIMTCGVHDGYPWCRLLELQEAEKTDNILDSLEGEFSKYSAAEVELVIRLSDRAARRSYRIPGTVLSAAIRKAPGLSEHVSAYRITVKAQPVDRCDLWIKACIGALP